MQLGAIHRGLFAPLEVIPGFAERRQHLADILIGDRPRNESTQSVTESVNHGDNRSVLRV
ncbi:MAG: hypothetical protein WD156_08745 [Acidimicrobiia bacterium]